MLFARYYFWIAPHVLLAVFLAAMLLRKLHARLPTFTAYVVFELVQFLVLLILGVQSPVPLTAYHWVLVCGSAISSLLVLGVIEQLADGLLFSRSSLRRVLRPVLRGILAGLVLIAAVVSGALWQTDLETVRNAFETVDFSSSLIQAGMLATLFILTRVLRISWRSWAAGIALGFGVSGSIDLASAGLRAILGSTALRVIDVTQMAGFHVCVLIWLVYAFQSEKKPPFTQKLKQSDLELWDQEVRRMVQR